MRLFSNFLIAGPLILSFAAAWISVSVFRSFGDLLGTYDIPNERSSHATPTLRGGGIVIVFICLASYVAAGAAGLGKVNWGYVAGAVMVAVISRIDDSRDVSAAIRLIIHTIAASALVITSALPQLSASFDIAHGAVYGLFIVWIVWMVNAYNFMDGIDGIAAVQGITAGAGWLAASLWFYDPLLIVFAAVITGSCLGFLLHNWSPAKVFMGDVGSAFLGFTFSSLPIMSAEWAGPQSSSLLILALSLLWLFVVDTAFTLFRRLLRGEKFWLAHREHIYQRIVIRGRSHPSVTLLYGGLSVVVTTFTLLSVFFGGIFSLLLVSLYFAAPATAIFAAIGKND